VARPPLCERKKCFIFNIDKTIENSSQILIDALPFVILHFMYNFTNKEILQLNQLPEPKEYIIKVGGKQFQYNRYQLPFLSN
jgi:hypothetical protein